MNNIELKVAGTASKIDSNTFTIKFDDKQGFGKGDILNVTKGSQLRILKVYRYTWFRRLLSKWFNRPFKFANCIKVEQIKN